MDRALIIRAFGLYLPTMAAAALAWKKVRTHRQIAALLAGTCWTLCSLLLLQILNQQFAWWRFHAVGGLLRGMPVDLYLGWTLLWGVLPTLVFPRANIWMVLGIFLALDLAMMPACAPVVELGSAWLIGEAAGLVLVLLPAALFARWSLNSTQLMYRSLLWAMTASSLLLFFVPEIFFAISGHGSWQAFLNTPAALRNMELQTIFVLAAPAFSAVQEFARRGEGTPIPYDPPLRLVTSGLYRYLANPMQTSGVMVFTAWAWLLKNPWLIMGGITIVIYCVGLAAWHEGQDMNERLGEPWRRYRANVGNWIPRWQPWHDPEATLPRLYIAEGCGQCSQVRRWLEARHPIGMEIVAAEDHPTRNLYRITYDPMDYDPMDESQPDEGVAAFARGLEHLSLGWAFAGAVLRFPLIRPLIQVLLDASGLGPQRIERRQCQVLNGG
jgi:protein-S-isoprenylcysteine O-methyltransferase Ste14